MTEEKDIERAFRSGQVQGQLDAIERMQALQNDRLDHHERRLATMEKITWGILGAIALVQSFDMIKAFMVS